MAVITPNSDIRLCNVPFDSTYEHTRFFQSASTQAAYFMGLSTMTIDTGSYSFIQKDSVLRVSANADTLYKYNYVMYRNTSFSDKWFYAFISRIEWRSDSSSDIHLETDVFQTWLTDLTFHKSYVIREHVSDDVAGNYTLNEGFETGTMVGNSASGIRTTFEHMHIVVSTSVTDVEVINATMRLFNKTSAYGNVNQGVYTGTALMAYPADSDGVIALNAFLDKLNQAGITDVISAIYMCPKTMMSVSETNGGKEPYSAESKKLEIKMETLPATLDGYTPVNKKLLTYPYRYIYAHNNAGSAAIYNIEDFAGTPSFLVYGTIHGNPTFKLMPVSYKGIYHNHDEAITLSGFPLCSWTYDGYTAWVAQHGASTAVSMLSTVGSAVGGALMGNPVIALGGAAGAAGTLAQAAIESNQQPPQSAGNAISGAANVAGKANNFYLEMRTIKAENAKMIDDYFSMYGYKVNKLKVPNMKTRAAWNYVQVNDLNVSGAVPSPDMSKIKSMFQKGITLWHNNDVGNYALANGVIGA